MKNTILILMIMPLFLMAQMRDTTVRYSPGDYLLIAKRNAHAAVIVGIAGTVISSVIIYKNSSDPTPGLVIGGISSLVSTILYLNAWNNIGKAGMEMNKRKIGIASNGIGISYRL